MASRYLDGPQRPEPRVPSTLVDMLTRSLAAEMAEAFRSGLSPCAVLPGYEGRLRALMVLREEDQSETLAVLRGHALAIIEGRER